MGRIDSHPFGANGFTLIEDTDAHVAGAGDHTDVEAWGPLMVYEDGTVFSSNCVVVKGDKPSSTNTYNRGDIVGAFFTTIQLTTAGVVHGQNIEELQDF